MDTLVKSGTIIEIINSKPVTYIVEVEGLPLLQVLHTRFSPRPQMVLAVGTRVSIFEINGEVKWAALEEEFVGENKLKNVTVISIDNASKVVDFQEDSGKIYRIRLSTDHSVWSRIHKSQKLQLEIKTEAEGKTKYRVILPAVDSAQSLQMNSTRFENDKKKSEDKTERDQSYAEKVGIDIAYFREREKENHRYEIMKFLAAHLQDDLVEWYQMRPAKAAQFASPAKPVSSTVERAIKSMDENFRQLYVHQARSMDSIRQGRNLIVVTQTASGKTLCYNPAIFENLIAQNAVSKALYVFPLNALLMDQKEKVDGLVKGLQEQGISVNAELLKGGVPQDRRRGMDKNGHHILMLNPELLSVILNEPQYWQNFFSNLKYVVVDEVHTYRGILGLHMAGILRRLLLQTRRLGSAPQFILSSATVSNPMDLAVRLTSLSESSFDLLSENDDGSLQAHKHWVVLNPDAHASGNGYDNYLVTAAMTMVEFLTTRDARKNASPLNTILFAKSIRDVNKVFKILQDNLQNYPHLRNKVRKYVSAELSSNEKREIYEGLKSGQLLGVVSTNALEAGIDIGKLDACIIAGFPFSVMRMRQMAGRVGRHQEGLVAFIPQPASSIDQYYRVNQQLLLEQQPEVFVIDPTNPYIARKHINAAAAYITNGVTERELSIFGANALDIVEQAKADGVMRKIGSQFFGRKWREFSNKSDPYIIGNIRSQAQIPYTVCRNPSGRCNLNANCLEGNNKERCEFQVAILDRQYAFRDCHPGAVYEAPDGVIYRATNLDDNKRVVHVEPLPEHTLERTFVEEDISIRIPGEIKAKKSLLAGVELQAGKVSVTRAFTGYFTYQLEPKSNCRKCRREYDADVSVCPTCGKKTSRSYKQSKTKRMDFPEPYNETGFRTTLDTMACWLKLPAELEDKLLLTSPCKLPGEQNKVADFLKKPYQPEKLGRNLRLLDAEKELLNHYHQEAGREIRQRKNSPHETTLYPGIYGQCMLSVLRKKLAEGRALEIFQAATGYPVTDELKLVCRKCQTSVLWQAMHTLEHTVVMRYPSVALGDSSDLGSFTRLGHSDTGAPTVFWYDNYDGGLGAAEKIFDKFQDLLAAGENTLTSCSCKSLEGCPNCTHIGHCDSQNEGLSKVALLALIALLQGKSFEIPFEPFVYRSAQKSKYESAYKFNEYVKYEHGVGKEAPESQQTVFDPYKILRIQREVHDPVLQKAFEVRGEEIANEVPPISVVELNQAYNKILQAGRSSNWNIQPQQDPFKILEILPSASLPMIQKIYHVIARQIHPDVYPGDKVKASEMMKLVNEAFDQARKEKRKDYSDDL